MMEVLGERWKIWGQWRGARTPQPPPALPPGAVPVLGPTGERSAELRRQRGRGGGGAGEPGHKTAARGRSPIERLRGGRAAVPVPAERTERRCRCPSVRFHHLLLLSTIPRCPPLAAMPNFSGNWKMKSSENFEELLKALGVNMMLRKIAVAAASKPAVEIKQDGESFYIKTSTTVRTTEISFRIGEEFEEQTVDGRPCKSLAKWESENKMVCEQRLLKGEGPRTGWSRELTNDGELILTMTADDVVCTRVYIRE
ncbi:cellular retinoic acid-binding protein 2 [Phasianus colchicus]|uniref:cellular retinoic acid-binding protein 2 n=1 Tax=Phasianus colchicus TaxID=9054 RepID=UPI00129E4D9F|nr:cellular retinoic acid-binding protein 2 [Phasianus colchicus]